MNWISVKDKLPEYSISVLVYQRKHNICVAWRLCTSAEGEIWSSEESDFEAHSDVTHWMVLPEAPIR